MRGIWFATGLAMSTALFAADATPAVANDSDPLPTVSHPVIYQLSGLQGINIYLIFSFAKCPEPPHEADIKFAEGSYGRGWLCQGRPQEFSAFQLKQDGQWYAGDAAQYIHDALLNGNAMFVPTHYQEEGPTKYVLTDPYRRITVATAQTVIVAPADWRALVARKIALAARTAPTIPELPASGALEADLGAAIAQAVARTPGFQESARLGAGSTNGNTSIVSSALMSQQGRFDVRPGASCVPLKGAQIRCTYAVKITVSTIFMRLPLPARTSPWITRTDVFTRSDGSFRSASVDQWMMRVDAAEKAAQARSSGAQPNNPASEPAGPLGLYFACSTFHTC